MIDAYEIGIQLMLQEDVSAGLAAIARGLAEVDRAILVTSADLAGLARDAEATTKAVSTTLNGRAALSGITDNKSRTADEQISQAEPRQASPSTPAKISETKATALEGLAADPIAPKQQTPSQQGDGPVGYAPDLREPVVPPSAPVRGAVADVISGPGQTKLRQDEPETAVRNAVTQAPPSTPLIDERQQAPVRDMSAAGQQRSIGVTPRATPVSVTASINREQRFGTAGRHAEEARHPSSADPVTQHNRPLAPRSAADQPKTLTATPRWHDQAAAPQSPARNQSEASGGTVMLDGHLVGQWLAEHMGREASRPPTGTSFFDPRQTPAWNVSGAL